jgi:hypothetical protein
LDGSSDPRERESRREIVVDAEDGQVWIGAVIAPLPMISAGFAASAIPYRPDTTGKLV